MIKKLNIDEWENLIVMKDGDSYFVSTIDFIDLQSSPTVFLDPTQSKVMDEWYGVSPYPLLHLSLFEIVNIIYQYNKNVSELFDKRPANCSCEFPRVIYRNMSGHHPTCDVHFEFLRKIDKSNHR